MRTYTRKSTQGFVSQELMQRAADAVIKYGRKIKTVARELDICHMSLYRFVKKLKSEVENITIGYKKVNLSLPTEEQEDKLAEYLFKCASDDTIMNNSEAISETVTKINDNASDTVNINTDERQIFDAPGPSGFINLPASSGVIEEHKDQGPFCPETVRPLLKAPPRIGTNKKSLKKSTILTDTLEKLDLAEEQSKKRKVSIGNEKVRKNKEKEKGKTKQESGKGKGKFLKRQVLQTSSESFESEEDSLKYFCLVCSNSSHSNSRSGEEWVLCQECKNWTHSRCR